MKSKLINGAILLTATVNFYMNIINSFGSEEDYVAIYEMGRKAKDPEYQITDLDVLQLLVNRSVINLKGEMNKDVQDIILSAFVYEDSLFPRICNPVAYMGETSND